MLQRIDQLTTKYPDLSFLLTSLLTLGLFYIPCLLVDFAYSDDFYGLWAQGIADNWAASSSETGRPFQGMINQTMFAISQNVAGLWKVRFISWVLLLLSSFILYKSFRKLFVRDIRSAILFSILPALLPSLSILVIWPSTFPGMVSLFLSLLAGALFACETKNKLLIGLFWLIGFTLLIFGLLTYQATCAACLIPWLILSGKSNDALKSVKKLILPLSGFLIANIGYFIGIKLYQSDQEIHSSKRTEMVSDFWDKLTWFIEHPLRMSASTFTSLESSGLRKAYLIVSLLGIVGGIALFFMRKKVDKKYLLITLWILALPVAYYTGLLVSENWPSYRTQSVLSMVFIFIYAIAVKGLFNENKRWIGASLLFVLFFFFGFKHVYNDFVWLQQHDWKKLQAEVHSIQLNKTTVIVRPNRNIGWEQGFVIDIGVDEFGIPSTSIDWNTELMVNIIYRDELKYDSLPQFNYLGVKDSAQFNSFEQVINLQDNFDDY